MNVVRHFYMNYIFIVVFAFFYVDDKKFCLSKMSKLNDLRQICPLPRRSGQICVNKATYIKSHIVTNYFLSSYKYGTLYTLLY